MHFPAGSEFTQNISRDEAHIRNSTRLRYPQSWYRKAQISAETSRDDYHSITLCLETSSRQFRIEDTNERKECEAFRISEPPLSPFGSNDRTMVEQGIAQDSSKH
ncbi:uncharacterized protein K444DRAFT_210865 [Hyaloscypha bicolor E]|uniref:Uncharacterized protein n=1 Tax=Hyaloscypha bicolor E TaxID=1095630 RepID=A0A2J6TPS4_9HELO|nr:uncharacterized protein K444DRAFT_210865 [Hyaloscypha bicolor E]PMD65009.1 hypothetical protein K444DRAFT_210865 [Hyaloscypha bicolor E]